MRNDQSVTCKKATIVLGSALVFLMIFLLSFFLGKFPISLTDFWRATFNKVVPFKQTWSSQVEVVLFQIRFPRIILAAVIGAGISIAGATYQAIFQNPMISQDILGASNGAAFGAATALFFALTYQQVIGLSFLFGLLAVGSVLVIDRFLRSTATLKLVLIGLMIGSLFSSAVSFLKLVCDPTNTLPTITYWLMGSLASSNQHNVFFAVPLILLGMLPIFLLRWQLNMLALGEEEALTLGVNSSFLRLVFIACATLITAAAVSVSGLIGWVGLVVPHFSRILVGQDYRFSIPTTALLGSSFLLLVDNCSRLLTTSEIPIGILTSFIGAPIFLILLVQDSRAVR